MHSTIEEHYKKSRDSIVKKVMYRGCSVHDAEDIVQNAYVRAMTYWKSFDGSLSLDKWFNRIVNRIFIDFKNAQKAGENVVSFESEDELEGTNDTTYTKEMIEEIKRRINSMKEPVREILCLHFMHQYRAVDISKLVDMNAGNVRQIIHRFKQELQEVYK